MGNWKGLIEQAQANLISEKKLELMDNCLITQIIRLVHPGLSPSEIDRKIKAYTAGDLDGFGRDTAALVCFAGQVESTWTWRKGKINVGYKVKPCSQEDPEEGFVLQAYGVRMPETARLHLV